MAKKATTTTATQKKANTTAKTPKAKTTAKTEPASTMKKTEIHKAVFDSLVLFDKLTTETEANARNTKCDPATLACNRDDCTIVVRSDSAVTRRFFEIWGLSKNECRVFMSKKEYEAIKTKKIEALVEKHLDEKLAAKYKKPVFKADYKTIINICQLMIDSLKAIDTEAK